MSPYKTWKSAHVSLSNVVSSQSWLVLLNRTASLRHIPLRPRSGEVGLFHSLIGSRTCVETVCWHLSVNIFTYWLYTQDLFSKQGQTNATEIRNLESTTKKSKYCFSKPTLKRMCSKTISSIQISALNSKPIHAKHDMKQ